MPLHLGNFFVFLVEMGFHHFGQVNLSSDPPALASQIAGITGVSYDPWPVIVFLERHTSMRILSSCPSLTLLVRVYFFF